MSVLLTYDIKKTTNTIHSELKERLKNFYGYSDKIKSDNGIYYDLPNTTLTKNGITPSQASENFIQACNDVGATWERYIAVEFSLATFNNK
jgi:hypothetical protein